MKLLLFLLALLPAVCPAVCLAKGGGHGHAHPVTHARGKLPVHKPVSAHTHKHAGAQILSTWRK